MNTGITKAIRDVLAERPMKTHEIATRLPQYPYLKIVQYLGKMTHNGELRHKGHGTEYQLEELGG